MRIIDHILQSDYFRTRPPILVDIGASGDINKKWKPIARYSVCIAFDADDREFEARTEKGGQYHSLIKVNRIVTADAQNSAVPFYLTASPFCSSLLAPDLLRLKPWVFSGLFKTEKIAMLPSTTLMTALREADAGYVDWFKADTQGTDLRLFQSLPPDMQDGILAAELEPGIIDAYIGEDKMFHVLSYMRTKSFWLSSFKLQGVQRLMEEDKEKLGSFLSLRILRKTPAWGEMTYLKEIAVLPPRDMLMLYVFSLLEKQYGFALEISRLAAQQYNDPLFRKCEAAVWRKLNQEKLKLPLVILKRQLNKLFSHIHD